MQSIQDEPRAPGGLQNLPPLLVPPSSQLHGEHLHHAYRQDRQLMPPSAIPMTMDAYTHLRVPSSPSVSYSAAPPPFPMYVCPAPQLPRAAAPTISSLCSQANTTHERATIPQNSFSFHIWWPSREYLIPYLSGASSISVRFSFHGPFLRMSRVKSVSNSRGVMSYWSTVGYSYLHSCILTFCMKMMYIMPLSIDKTPEEGDSGLFFKSWITAFEGKYFSPFRTAVLSQ